MSQSTTLLLTVPDTAKLLAISQRKLWSLTATGEIPCIRIGRSVRYALDDLRDWIQKLKFGWRKGLRQPNLT